MHDTSLAPRLRWFAVLLLILLVAASCSEKNPPELSALREYAPDLSEVTARHLVLSDDSTLAQYVSEAGIASLLQSGLVLMDAIRLDSVEGYRRSLAVMLPNLRRLSEAIEAEYDYHGPLENCRTFDELSDEQGLEWRRVSRDSKAVFRDPSIAPKEKIEMLMGYLEQHDNLTASVRARMWGRVNTKSAIAETYANMGDDEATMAWFQSTISDCYEIRDYTLLCHLLGAVGSIYEDRGQIDSMIVYYEEALRLANRFRFPYHTARILSFYSHFYARQGRLSLSHDLRNEAIELCRRYKGGHRELRFLLDAMRFYAELEAWEIVGRLLPRARSVERLAASEPSTHPPRYGHSVNRLEARYLMATGRVEEGRAIFDEIERPIAELPWPVIYPEFLLEWTEALLQNGRPREALTVVNSGMARAREMRQTRLVAQFSILKATATMDLGMTEETTATLEEFMELSAQLPNGLRREWVSSDVLHARVHRERGDTTAAVAALGRGLARMEESLADSDEGVHGYLWMGRCGELRQQLHDLVSGDPELGYGLEFVWRDAYRLLGSRSDRGAQLTSGPAEDDNGYSVLDRFRVTAQAMGSRLVSRSMIHSVYLIRANDIWRWTRTPDGIRREALGVEPRELAELVSRTWRQMADDPIDTNATVGAELAADLRHLARVLLPAEALVGAAAGPFLVSADGFLGQIPFETLDVGAGNAYVPLLARRDVAYLRHGGKLAARSSHSLGTVVTYSGGTTLQPELDLVFEEGRAVAARNPGSVFLHGDRATKKNLLASWENGSFLYAAGHSLRDPDVPYLTLFPLAPEGGQAGPDAAYLDVRDIRSADFTKCDVVVLSGCATGAPYVGARNAAPSMGDAFLDAGAGMVVQTFWDVRDDEAAALMSSFVENWGDSNFGMIGALCESRRAVMRGGQGIRHPFHWAAYSIKLGRF